jgi:hypothetical protein
MRTYLHDPDLRWVRARYDRAVARLDRVTLTIDRRRDSGSVGVTLYNTAIEIALTVAQFAWALEEPSHVVRDSLDVAGRWVNEAVEQGVELRLGQAETWLEISILSGARVVTSVADGPEALRNGDEAVVREFVVALARLADGDREAAAHRADAMNGAAASTDGSPETVAYFEGLGDLIRAVAARDQRQFERASTARVDALVREFGRSIEQRRHRYGLLDPRGAAVTALAWRDGLRIPGEYAYLGAELIETD